MRMRVRERVSEDERERERERQRERERDREREREREVVLSRVHTWDDWAEGWAGLGFGTGAGGTRTLAAGG